ncbi:hypothetical protein AURDEDRAFT_181116 [Auricularia subglabra TFB-10046 SS5]|nr:hypothetical protein AURDEDRAFT_181116 [Auricularia subglabra TFB-10046 SS5]
MDVDSEPPYKRLKLSLERPYKDDNGERILPLLDITPEGELVYKQREEPVARLGENLGRIIHERGIDFFDKYHEGGDWRNTEPSDPAGSDKDSDDESDDKKAGKSNDEEKQKAMTFEELRKMREDMIPHLYVAFGEMSLARDLLSLVSSSSALSSIIPGLNEPPPPIPNLPPGTLTGSVVSKPPPLPSVQLFNSQLTLGSKDQALRKASDVLRDAAESMERNRKRDEAYWVNGLKARAANWTLVPAPLPPGAPVGKNSDRTARDFAISFGLEEAPPEFKRRALGYLSDIDRDIEPVVFQRRQKTRLRISLTTTSPDDSRSVAHNTLRAPEGTEINSVFTYVQQELIEQEIFSELFREAEKLPTADTRVTERLIVVDIAHTAELSCTMVPSETCDNTADEPLSPLCDLIHSCLSLLLLRKHAWMKENHHLLLKEQQQQQRLPTQAPPPTPPLILQPVIDLIQYRSFCDRVAGELRKVCLALHAVGVHARMRLTRVGESGNDLVKLLTEPGAGRIGGAATLRVAHRPTFRLTFHSPSTLIAQTSQANVTIGSIAQLAQVLHDEVELAVLERLCASGKTVCGDAKALWFVDSVSSRTMGRWGGHSATFHVSLKNGEVVAGAWTIRSGVTTAVSVPYTGQPDLLSWANGIIHNLSAQ